MTDGGTRGARGVINGGTFGENTFWIADLLLTINEQKILLQTSQTVRQSIFAVSLHISKV